MQALRGIFGRGLPDPTGSRISRWRSDPLAGGSFSFYAVGSSSADCATLATPAAPRLLLAGEYTHAEHPATVHGAWLSGVRAARQAAAMLGS
jgi:monoamine oxidase